MTPESKSKRRWFRFSLRTFFVLLTVFCVWLGGQVHRAKQQQEAVEWIEAMGGTVNYDYEDKPPEPKWLREAIGSHFFDDVHEVRLSDTQVDDLTPLANLSGLEEIWLERTQVKSLVPLANLSHLRRLFLDDTLVSDVTPLGNHKNLEWLYLNNTQVSDLTPLANSTSLEDLYLNDTRVSREQVTALRQTIPKCRIFW